jgi:hypothetical protein
MRPAPALTYIDSDTRFISSSLQRERTNSNSSLKEVRRLHETPFYSSLTILI